MLLVISDAIGEQKDDWTMNEPAQTPVITDIDKKNKKKHEWIQVYTSKITTTAKNL